MIKNSNSQIIAYNAPDAKPSCNRCGSENLKLGAGRKPQEQSKRCSDCGQFLGYQPLERLKKLRKRRKLTESLNLLESHGIKSEAAQLFLLSATGGEA